MTNEGLVSLLMELPPDAPVSIAGQSIQSVDERSGVIVLSTRTIVAHVVATKVNRYALVKDGHFFDDLKLSRVAQLCESANLEMGERCQGVIPVYSNQ